MALTPEGQLKVQLWRQKSREGTLTPEELREAIIFLRQDRVTAAATSEKSRAKKAKPAANSDDLLNELEGL